MIKFFERWTLFFYYNKLKSESYSWKGLIVEPLCDVAEDVFHGGPHFLQPLLGKFFLTVTCKYF